MARRKCVGVKWTLVLVVVIFCQIVYSRPQDSTTISLSTNNSKTDKSTENLLRYRLRQTLSRSDLPIGIRFALHNFKSLQNIFNLPSNYNKVLKVDIEHDTNNAIPNRNERMISKTAIRESNERVREKKPNKIKTNNNELISKSKTPMIRKIITKWSDKTKYEDLDLSEHFYKSSEKKGDTVNFSNSLSLEEVGSTESSVDLPTPTEKRPQSHYPNKFYSTPYTDFESEDQNVGVVHSNKVHIIEYPFPSVRPAYIFTTPMPTPIITNAGNPKPWISHKIIKNKPVSKPVYTKPNKEQYNYHNTVHNNYPQYPGPNFEVTTFQPHNTYTERIVIRPEEYSASDDCPTLYLTLNNTFQGQAKEACPDLNIAVNTNVVNKNVVVESDEEDSLFPGGFDLPEGEDSESDDAAAADDYFDSDEAQEQDQSESASIEPQGLSNYHAGIETESFEGVHGSHGTQGSHASLGGGKPGKPNGEDELSLSGIVSFFKPAINAMSWLAAISPFSFSIISMLLTPIALLMAGYSGAAALFAPLGLAREATPKIVHVYRPKWEWDDKYKTWYLNTFPNNRRWRPARLPRNSKEVTENDRSESLKPTLFYKIKHWMKDLTTKLNNKKNEKNKPILDIPKSSKKKREAWTRRIK